VTLVNPNSALTDTVIKGSQAGAATLGLQVEIVRASTDHKIEAVLASISQAPGVPLLLGPDPSFTSRRLQLVTLAARGVLGIGAPRSTPVEIVERLNREVNAVLAEPTVQAR
jgi:hypothetical protein